MSVQIPKMLKSDEGHLVPEGSIFLSTSGLPGFVGLGLILSRTPIPASSFSKENQKAFYKSFGWSTPHVDRFVAQVSKPARGVFVSDRDSRKQLWLYNPSGRHGCGTESIEPLGPTSKLPYGLPCLYEDELRHKQKLMHAEWNLDSYRGLSNSALIAKGTKIFQKYMAGDGWINVSAECQEGMNAGTLYTKASSGYDSYMGVVTFDGVDFLTGYDTPMFSSGYGSEGIVNATITSDPTSAGRISAAYYAQAWAAANPEYVFVVGCFGQGGTPMNQEQCVVLRRMRRPEDGDVMVYGVRVANPDYVWNSAVHKTGDPAICLLKFDGPSGAGGSRSSRAGTFMRGLVPEEGVRIGRRHEELPEGISNLSQEFPCSEPFYVYGWAGHYDVTLVDYSSAEVSALEGGFSRIKLEETARHSHISKPALVSLLQARAEGMAPSDREHAFAEAQKVAERDFVGVWATGCADSVDTSLENVVKWGPLAEFDELTMEQWHDIDFRYMKEDDTEGEAKYNKIRGEVKEMPATLLFIQGDNALGGASAREIRLSKTDMGEVIYTMGGVSIDRDDAMDEIASGASLNQGSGSNAVTLQEAFGVETLAELKKRAGLGSESGSAFSDGRLWFARSDNSQNLLGLAFHHILGQKDQSTKVLGMLDFHSFRTVIK